MTSRYVTTTRRCIEIKHMTIKWAAPSEFVTYRLCEQRRFRRACASAQSRQNLRCSLIQTVSQEEPSDRNPDPWPLWMAGHEQLKFVMTECSKTQIRLTGLKYYRQSSSKCYLIPKWCMQRYLYKNDEVGFLFNLTEIIAFTKGTLNTRNAINCL